MSVVLIDLKEKSLEPYWNEDCKNVSDKLWLPTKTDWQGWGDIPQTFGSNRTVESSWFSSKILENHKKHSLVTAYFPSCITSVVRGSGTEIIRVKKLRMYPTPIQKQMMQQWLGTSRYTYNKTVEYLGQKDIKQHWMIASPDIIANLADWAKLTPYQIKNIAIRDAFNARNAGVRKFRDTGKPFKLSFRTRRNSKQSCFIPSNAINKKGIYVRSLGSMKYAEQLPTNVRDSRLVLENNRWFLHVSYSSKANSADNQGRIVALDPGVRTFLTGFSENLVFKLGEDSFKKLARLYVFMDQLVSKISKNTGSKRVRLKRALKRMRARISNLVDEIHFKSIRFLADNFDYIILPTFRTSSMTKRLGRKINSKTVRAMLGYSFFKFAQRLEAALDGKVLIRTSEAYTSKTASWTGEIKQIGSAKTITSESITVDRDVNGARGIFLRALRDSSLVSTS